MRLESDSHVMRSYLEDGTEFISLLSLLAELARHWSRIRCYRTRCSRQAEKNHLEKEILLLSYRKGISPARKVFFLLFLEKLTDLF